MDYLLFYFLSAFGLVLFFFGLMSTGGTRLSLTWLTAAIFLCMALLMVTGENITSTTVIDENLSVETILAIGISVSNLVIIFVLFSIVCIVLGTFS